MQRVWRRCTAVSRVSSNSSGVKSYARRRTGSDGATFCFHDRVTGRQVRTLLCAGSQNFRLRTSWTKPLIPHESAHAGLQNALHIKPIGENGHMFTTGPPLCTTGPKSRSARIQTILGSFSRPGRQLFRTVFRSAKRVGTAAPWPPQCAPKAPLLWHKARTPRPIKTKRGQLSRRWRLGPPSRKQDGGLGT